MRSYNNTLGVGLRPGFVLSMAASLLLLGGCERLFNRSFLDQSELVPADMQSGLVVKIHKQIDPADEPSVEFPTAEDVKAADLKPVRSDYRIGPNDLVQVGVYEAMAAGTETVRVSRVTETGMLMVPGLREPVKASGFTEAELQRVVAERLKEGLQLVNPQVSVTITEARQRTFTVSGAVNAPGQYVIYQADFRVLDALVAARDATYQPDYIYVIRKLESERPSTQPARETGTTPATKAVDPLAPRTDATVVRPVLAADTPAPKPPVKDDGKYIFIEGRPRPAGSQPTTMPSPGGPDVTPAGGQPKFEFGALSGQEDSRIIRISYAGLRRGELQNNIIVRPGDMIVVPQPLIGEYFMGGHVARPGAYTLTGRQLTLQQAVISAGMLDAFGVPERAYVVRRVKRGAVDEQVFVKVDLVEIFQGRQPDVFLKPYDNVLVGTNAFSPFLNAIRSGFRMSYGAGFLYDRNFAYSSDYYKSRF